MDRILNEDRGVGGQTCARRMLREATITCYQTHDAPVKSRAANVETVQKETDELSCQKSCPEFAAEL
jgi:hypothetical protein